VRTCTCPPGAMQPRKPPHAATERQPAAAAEAAAVADAAWFETWVTSWADRMCHALGEERGNLGGVQPLSARGVAMPLSARGAGSNAAPGFHASGVAMPLSARGPSRDHQQAAGRQAAGALGAVFEAPLLPEKQQHRGGRRRRQRAPLRQQRPWERWAVAASPEAKMAMAALARVERVLHPVLQKLSPPERCSAAAPQASSRSSLSGTSQGSLQGPAAPAVPKLALGGAPKLAVPKLALGALQLGGPAVGAAVPPAGLRPAAAVSSSVHKPAVPPLRLGGQGAALRQAESGVAPEVGGSVSHAIPEQDGSSSGSSAASSSREPSPKQASPTEQRRPRAAVETPSASLIGTQRSSLDATPRPTPGSAASIQFRIGRVAGLIDKVQRRLDRPPPEALPQRLLQGPESPARQPEASSSRMSDTTSSPSTLR